MKICSNCGKECADEIRFCMFCGNPFPADTDFVTPENRREEAPEQESYAGYSEQQQYSQQYDGQQYNEQYDGQQYGGQQYAPPAQKQSNGFAVAALVLGIVGMIPFFYFFVIQILAIVFGAVGISKAKKTGTGRGMAIAGLVLGIVAIVIIIIIVAWATMVATSLISSGAFNDLLRALD